MNVSESISNFRAAMLAVIPAFERAGIPWRRPDAYDQWDAVATALFEALVASVQCSRLAESLQTSFALAPYDSLMLHYRRLSTIEVVLVDRPDAVRRVFHALGTTLQPLDSVEFRKLSTDDTPDGSVLETLPLEAVAFRLRVTDPTTGDEVLTLE